MDSAPRASAPPSSPGRRSRRRRTSRGVPVRVDAWLLGLLCLLVWGSLLAIGTVHLVAELVVALVATAGAGLCFESGRLTKVPLPALIAWLLAAYTLLQALPLPLSWVDALSPVTGDTWSRVLRPLDEPPPRWAALSLAPRATLVEALKWWSYGCAFSLAFAVIKKRGPKVGIAIVLVSGVLAATITLIHGVFGASQVFGLYDPSFVPGRWTVGPLLNSNNLAGYLNLALFCGVGLLLGSSAVKYRYWLALALMLLVATSFLAASRGGVLGLFFGILLTVPAAWLLRRSGIPLSRYTLLALASMVALGLTLALVGATRDTWRSLYDANLSKLELAVWAKPMIADHPWFGVGRGAFETVLPVYHQVPGHISYTHPENFVAQWASEWGLVVAALAFGGFAWAFRPSALQIRRSATAMGALIGALALLLQNLVDLALEVPAVVIALSVVLASLLKPESTPSEPAIRPRVRAVALAAAGLLLVSTAAFAGTNGIGSVRLALHEEYASLDVKNERGRSEFFGHLRREMASFPADPYLPLLGALVAFRSNADPMPWLTRTLERDQTASRAHFLLAEVLKRRQAIGQAMMELRLATEADPALGFRAGILAVKWTKDRALLMRALPADKAGVEPLVAMARAAEGRQYDSLREDLLREALQRDPYSTAALAAHSNHLLEALSSGVPRCDQAARAACFSTIEQHRTRLEQLDPGGFPATEIAARLLIVRGEPERADALLEQVCFASFYRSACLRLRMQAAAATKDHDRLAKAAKDYSTSGCSSASECVKVATNVGEFLVQRGLHSDALGYLERAAREAPSVPAWLAVADCAEKAGATARQIAALRQAERLPGGQNPEVERRLKQALASSSSLFLLKKPVTP